MRSPGEPLPVCLITQRSLCPDRASFSARLGAAAQAGLSMLVIREPDLGGAALARLVSDIREVLVRRQRPDLPLLVSRRLDVALATGAAGVHLPARGLAVDAVRRLVPGSFRVGVSTHSVDEVIAAQRRGADHAFLGPVFPTDSHPGHPGRGVGLLRQATSATSIPLWAIGGIGAHNVDAVRALPVAGVAVIRAVWTAVDAAAAVRRLAGG
ncbi:MAG: thiamine phosphate synthase [Acidobacteriota bacterium]